jgi:hypothetical protein
VPFINLIYKYTDTEGSQLNLALNEIKNPSDDKLNNAN